MDTKDRIDTLEEEVETLKKSLRGLMLQFYNFRDDVNNRKTLPHPPKQGDRDGKILIYENDVLVWRKIGE